MKTQPLDGRPMVAVKRGSLCTYIDAFEVTDGAFEKYVAAGASLNGAPDYCMEGASAPPQDAVCAMGAKHFGPMEDNPVVCVTWCRAAAYCAWAGKRLCETLDNDATNPEKSEWLAACSSGGKFVYPYGDTASASKCNTSESPHGCDAGQGCETAPTGSFPSCIAGEGEASIFDLQGNVAEWTNECTESSLLGTCAVRGGSINTKSGNATCVYSQGFKRTFPSALVGFRCCAD